MVSTHARLYSNPLFIPALSYVVFTFNSIPFVKKYDFVSLFDDLVGVTFWTQIVYYCLQLQFW
jgi:hypothetical protein